ncbi:MAG: hypothetical protein R8J85_08925 [Mariprofundales bacterium]
MRQIVTPECSNKPSRADSKTITGKHIKTDFLFLARAQHRSNQLHPMIITTNLNFGEWVTVVTVTVY